MCNGCNWPVEGVVAPTVVNCNTVVVAWVLAVVVVVAVVVVG